MANEIEITENILEQGKSARGSWSRAQLEELGVPWPLEKGWKSRLIGQRVNEESVDRFIAMRVAYDPAQIDLF